MRSASSYRGAKKKAAREANVPFAKFNEHYARSRMFAAHELERKALNASPEAARKALAIWAANGGRATAVSQPADLAAMNALSAPPEEIVPEEVAAALEAAKKITPEDIDKAMESALTRWQADRRDGPMPLSTILSARARALGWVEDVEFYEET